MTLAKSLVLGGAAVLVAVAGAQAADLPVKAKPVAYVKVCSLYGDGFFYIPGTDTCIKIGGWVRYEVEFATAGSDNPYIVGGNGRNNAVDSAEVSQRARTLITLDTRSQTEYGTLRSYFKFGFTNTGGATAGSEDGTTGRLYTELAFIQLGGWTMGKARSFFDGYSNLFSYGMPFYVSSVDSATIATGQLMAAYTWQLGNGVSFTLAAEDPTTMRSGLWDATNTAQNALTIGLLPGPATFNDDGFLVALGIGDYAAPSVPDIVADWRLEQGWGSAHIAGALHQLRAGPYGADAPAGFDGVNTGTRPADKYGFAVEGGFLLNAPTGAGDKVSVEAAYSQGALGRTGWQPLNAGPFGFSRFGGNTVAAAWSLEGIFANANSAPGGAPVVTAIELTTGWGVSAAYEHYWTQALRTSVFGSYSAVSFDQNAQIIMCNSPQSPYRTTAGAAPTAAQFAAAVTGGVNLEAGCNPNFDNWNIGTRTIWNPVANLDVGLEVTYTKLETKSDPSAIRLNFAGAGGRAAGLYVPSAEGVWSSIFRVQRNFWP